MEPVKTFISSNSWKRLSLLVIFPLFMVFGITLFSVGVYQLNTLPANHVQDSDNIADPEDEAYVKIIHGCLTVGLGTFGLVGVLLRLKIMLMVNIALILLEAILALYGILSTASKLSGYLDEYKSKLKVEVVTNYGAKNRTSDESFTKFIDEHQENEKCCGWTGEQKDNIFLNSTWYKTVNAGKTDNLKTLPDSCCAKAGDECVTAKNIMEAREKGAVHEEDCIESITSITRNYILGVRIQNLLFLVLAIAALAITVLHLIEIG